MSEILKQAISFGGDTDSIAAVACGWGCLSVEVENDLPQNLYDNLENGKYGLNFLKELDQKLFDRFPRRY